MYIFVHICEKHIDKFRILYHRSCTDDKNEKDSMEVDFMVFNILLAIIGLIVGLGLGFMVAKSRHEKEIAGAQSSAAGIIDSAKKEAETLKKEALLEAKEENQKYRSEVESELRESKLELKSQENRLIQREQTLNRKDDSLEKRENSLESKEEALSSKQQLIEEREKDVEKLVEDQQKELEKKIKYNTDNLFKKEHIKSNDGNSVNIEEHVTTLIKKEESIFIKIWNKIKNIFRRK